MLRLVSTEQTWQVSDKEGSRVLEDRAELAETCHVEIDFRASFLVYHISFSLFLIKY